MKIPIPKMTRHNRSTWRKAVALTFPDYHTAKGRAAGRLRFFSGDLRAVLVVVPNEGGYLPQKIRIRLPGKSIRLTTLLSASGSIRLRMLVIVGAINNVSAKSTRFSPIHTDT
jgi:hypothetical protein